MSTYKTRSATSRGATRSTTTGSHADQNNTASRKLRPISPEELHSWSDGDSDDTYTEPELCHLDESRPYTFESGDLVWVKTSGGDWYIGRVSGLTRRKGPTRRGEGIFYPVTFFDGKVRKYFAPLNGEIKPDTEEVRALLKAGGWFRELGGNEH